MHTYMGDTNQAMRSYTQSNETEPDPFGVVVAQAPSPGRHPAIVNKLDYGEHYIPDPPPWSLPQIVAPKPLRPAETMALNTVLVVSDEPAGSPETRGSNSNNTFDQVGDAGESSCGFGKDEEHYASKPELSCPSRSYVSEQLPVMQRDSSHLARFLYNSPPTKGMLFGWRSEALEANAATARCKGYEIVLEGPGYEGSPHVDKMRAPPSSMVLVLLKQAIGDWAEGT